jgi:hypothetical protein
MAVKRMFQVFILLALLFSPFGSIQHAQAGTNLVVQTDTSIVTHNLSVWNAIYYGYVNATTYERWQFAFGESHKFVVNVTPVMNGMVPILILLDANGNEITRANNTLTTTQPAGNYSIQVQPESGSDLYSLTLREIVQTQPSVSTIVSPTSLNVGETAVVTVGLNNIPSEGYTSAEFTCAYNPSLGEVSNIVVANLFGADAAAAINGPQNGSFIVAIAGSNGFRATAGGTAFTFSIKGLQPGQTAVECTARVSKGDNVLNTISSTAGSLTVLGSTFTPTPVETSTPIATATPVESATPTSTPVESSTPTSTPVVSETPSETATPTETFTPTATSTPLESPTPTLTSSPTATEIPTTGTLTGKVLASKPVMISLLNADNSVATSMLTNADGTFSLTATAGTYTISATAIGFLSAQGPITLTAGGTAAMPEITLLAGDIDNNGVIDQFDAMTIGMSYNTAIPAAADLNNDGVINVLDLEILAHNYRLTGPVAWQ